MVADSDASQANAVKTMLDTIIAPKDAFNAIRNVPTWGLALAVAIVLSAVGTYLLVPAMQHGFAGTFAHMATTDPRIAAMSQDQLQSVIAMQQKILGFTWLFVLVGVPFWVLIAAVFMLVFDKIGRGDGSFAKYWGAACNIAVVTGLGTIVTAVIALARGAESFPTMLAVQTAIPSLALLAPGAGVKLATFLGVITPFSLWSAGLTIAAVSTIGRARPFSAWLCGILMLVVPALLAAAGAK